MSYKNAARHLPIVICTFLVAFAVVFAFPITAHAKTIFLGDSRTVGMYNTVAGYAPSGIVEDQVGDDAWKAAGGEGYSWFTSEALPYAEQVREPEDAIVILMGCNDLGGSRYADYAELVNDLAAQWKEDDVSCFFVSVNPISDGLAASNGYAVHNSQVVAFNEGLEPLLSDDVIWIDTYSLLESDGYDTFDGVHYSQSTCQVIYNECKEAVDNHEENLAAAAELAHKTQEAIEEEKARQEAAENGELKPLPATTSAALDSPSEAQAKATDGITFPNGKSTSPSPVTVIALIVAAIAAVLLIASVMLRRPRDLGNTTVSRRRRG